MFYCFTHVFFLFIMRVKFTFSIDAGSLVSKLSKYNNRFAQAECLSLFFLKQIGRFGTHVTGVFLSMG